MPYSIREIADMVSDLARDSKISMHQAIEIISQDTGVSSSLIGHELALRAISVKEKERRDALEELRKEMHQRDAKNHQEELEEGFRDCGHLDDLY